MDIEKYTESAKQIRKVLREQKLTMIEGVSILAGVIKGALEDNDNGLKLWETINKTMAEALKR